MVYTACLLDLFSCGLVALRMAAEFLLPSLETTSVTSTSYPTSSSNPTAGTISGSTSFDGDPDVAVHVTPLLLLAKGLQFTNEGLFLKTLHFLILLLVYSTSLLFLFLFLSLFLFLFLLINSVGEIFSSDDLAVLGGRHYGLRVEVLRPFSSQDVIRHLLCGLPFLIPYPSPTLFFCHPLY